MDKSLALFYGVIQGLTEFLPISSSGHLALIPHLMKVQDPGQIFDLYMHLGTAFSIIVYFWKDIKNIVFYLIKSPKENWSFNFVLATTASVILILIIKDISYAYGRTPLVIGISLIFFGILMWAADRFSKTDKSISLFDKLDKKRSLMIGLSQAMAVFPGVSRSGVTMTMGRALNMSLHEASRFSFLLSLPLIFMACFKKAYELEGVLSVDHLSLFIGVFSSFIAGLITIHYFLKFIQKISLGYFAIYRIILGVLVIYFSYYGTQ